MSVIIYAATELNGYGDARRGFLSATRTWVWRQRKCINVREPQGSQYQRPFRTLSSPLDLISRTMCVQLHRQLPVLLIKRDSFPTCPCESFLALRDLASAFEVFRRPHMPRHALRNRGPKTKGNDGVRTSSPE